MITLYVTIAVTSAISGSLIGAYIHSVLADRRKQRKIAEPSYGFYWNWPSPPEIAKVYITRHATPSNLRKIAS